MECMINSDNVVRGGLTPKLKDVETLVEILPYSARSAPEVWTSARVGGNDGYQLNEFLTDQFQELRILTLTINAGCSETIEMPKLDLLSVAIVMSGKGSIEYALGGHSATLDAPSFSTFYIAPKTELKVQRSNDSTEPLVIYFASPKL